MKKRYTVYFWTTECGQFVKIGHCQDLYRRRSEIQTGCPLPLCEYPAGVIVCEDEQDMRKVERATHKQFKAHRMQGEWFELADEISEHIQAFTDTESGKAFVDEGRQKEREYQRKRSTPEYREYCRERYANDPEYRKHLLENQRKRRRERYANNPEYRKRKRERERERRKDPKVRKRENKRARERYARKKRENQQINGQQLTLPIIKEE